MPIYNVSRYLNESDDILEEYSLLINTNQYEFNNCVDNLLETGYSILESEDSVITEGLIADYKDQIKQLITTITKGKETAIRQNTEAAKQAADYKNKIESLLRNNKELKHKIDTLNEFMVETIYTGTGTISTYYYKQPTFSGIVIDFKKVSKLIKDENYDSLQTLLKNYKDKVDEICMWGPTIVKYKSKKKTVGKIAEFLSNLIELNKDISKGFEESINKMKDALDDAYNIMNDLDNKNAIKFMNKFINLQKALYNHDLALMNTNNLMILRQSRDLKKLIDKYSE